MNELTIVATLLHFYFCSGLDNGLVRTPPMGWLSWAKFLCQVDCQRHPLSCISEQLYIDMADRLVEDGYLEAGYKFVNIDDCWPEMSRDSSGQLVANRTRFPHGIRWLADYLHKRGLEFGTYEDFGNYTCGGYPGSFYHLEDDAKLFASWEIDMLKLDGCYASPAIMPAGYPEMGKYLNATGRPIVYSCSWPAYELSNGRKIRIETNKPPDYVAIAKACNLWRNYDDIMLRWSSIQGIINWYDQHQNEMIPVHGPGQWNDPDMIIVGNMELSVDQSKAQMAIWSIWSAPLFMSNDLRFMPTPYKDILLNKKVIAVDQDPLGRMGRLVINTTFVGIYIKAMTPYNEKSGQYSYAIVFFNRHSTKPANVTIARLSNLGMRNPPGYKIEELFTNENHGFFKPEDGYKCTINPTGVVMIKATMISS